MKDLLTSTRHPGHSGWLQSPRVRLPFLFLLAGITLWIDYITGPTILFPIWYALPVVLAGWYVGFALASGFAVVLPLGRLTMKFIWPVVPWPMSHSLINFVIRILALETIAWLAARSGRLTREIRVLQGLLPICIYCHRMRNDNGSWERLEAYLDRRSEATFTHGICPECLSFKGVKA